VAKKPNKGMFQPGRSGNPAGKNRGLERQLRDQFGGRVPELVGVLIDLALGKTPRGYEDAEIKTSDRIKANAEALDRILGKPAQTVDGEVSVGISPDQAAILAAISLTPHERRLRQEALDREDEEALAAAGALDG
jgi:hypothetical protein